MKQIFSIIIFCCTIHFISAQQDPLITKDIEAQQKWVDSVYNSLNTKQRIGQLFMVDAFSGKGKAEENRLKKLIQQQYIGGVIFSKGGPVRQAQMCNHLQDSFFYSIK